MADQVSAIIADLSRYTENEVVALTLDITANLRETTPRDTGWAAANWMPSRGFPAPAVESIGGRPPEAVVAAAAADQASREADLHSYKLADGSTFCTNGVPYIQILNEGHSRQAPPAFVEAAIVRAVDGRSRK